MVGSKDRFESDDLTISLRFGSVGDRLTFFMGILSSG